MSFSSIILLLILVSVLATISDKYIMKARLAPFRQGLQDFWHKFDSHQAKNLTQSWNTLFCNLFDLVYGKKAFSRRRLIASCISSLTAYFVLFLIGYLLMIYFLGFEQAAITGLNIGHFLLSLFIVVIINLIPDFISLAETRLVLNWSKNRGLIGVSFFILIDLIATTLVFLVVGAFLSFVSIALIELFEDGKLASSFFDFLGAQLVKLKGGDIALVLLVSLATTFFTSFFWICFVACYVMTRIAYRLFPLTRYIYEQIVMSEKPATALAGFLNIFLLLIWGVFWGLNHLLA